MKTNKEIIEEAIKRNTIEWEGIEIERNREVTIEKALQIKQEDMIEYFERLLDVPNNQNAISTIQYKKDIKQIIEEELKQKLEEKDGK